MTNTPVDVVIPVYRDIEATRAAVVSALVGRSVCRIPYQVTVIDDRTPEPDLASWLDALGGVVKLIRNPTNLGFVANANLAFAMSTDRDVVLLNSDAEVAGDWLDRLAAAARALNVATVTPFSNNGDIVSYPHPLSAHVAPSGGALAEIDALFARVNRGKYVDLPTAVGFCTYFTRAGLAVVGPFDETAFGRGYGEETDYCCRALRHGFRHLLAGDVFVAHRGGASFGSESAARKDRALALIQSRHPDYWRRLTAHLSLDPARPHRDAVSLWRYRARRLPLTITAKADDRAPNRLFIGRWGEGLRLWHGDPDEAFNLGITQDAAVSALPRLVNALMVGKIEADGDAEWIGRLSAHLRSNRMAVLDADVNAWEILAGLTGQQAP